MVTNLICRHYFIEFKLCLCSRNLTLLFLVPGNTPLHIAAGRKLKEIVALLMAYGANPAIANGEGDFPSDLPASLLVGKSLISL